MPESIAQSEKDHNKEEIKKTIAYGQDNEHVSVLVDGLAIETSPLIIWTPRFIVCFVLVLVIGLSVANITVQGWLNGYYAAEVPELVYCAGALGCWVGAIFVARSVWIRLGAIFCAISALFTITHMAITLRIPIEYSWTVVSHIIEGRNLALLGGYVCLSIAYTPLRRWDTWFFRFAPIAYLGIVILAYFLVPTTLPLTRALTNNMGIVALYGSVAVWWLRPSCWRAQPGPTFLLGSVPALYLLLSIPFPHSGEPTLFLTHILFLLLALGALRILQYEQRLAQKRAA